MNILRSLRHLGVAGLLAVLCFVKPASAQVSTLYGLPDDREVSSAGAVNDVNPMKSGYSGATVMNPVAVFQLPTLPAGKQFSAASLKLYLQGREGTPTFNADLYALGVSSNSTVLPGDCYAGALDTSMQLIQDNFLTTADTSGSKTTSATVLTDYLNAAYANGTGAGEYVFFRLSPDEAGLNNYTRYKIYSREYSGGAYYWPTLTYTVVDAPPAGWRALPLGGGGKVTGLIGSPNGSDIYIRTDVGGAYRWDAVASSWVHLTDKIVPLASGNPTDGPARLMGCAALAVDPSNTNQLYVAVGDLVNNGIFFSPDKGATWTCTNPSTPILMEPNVKPINVDGERLAVDPNNPNIVWFGSTQNGLYKGVKSGGAWTWTQVPSSQVPFGTVSSGSNHGVTFVVCDKNGSSTITYAGVYDDVGSTGGVYRTTDGTVWTKVTGVSLTVPTRAAITSTGTLYVAQNGTVAKMPRGGSFTSITPLAGIPYHSIDVCSTGGNDIVCVGEYPGNTSFNRIWRSTDGGGIWSMQQVNFNNLSYVRTEDDGTPSLMTNWFVALSDLLINPANPNELWACDLYGVSRTQDAQNLGSTNGCQWYAREQGLEETVVMAIKNAPTGVKLMTGVADVGGFCYDTDTSVRPVANSLPIGGNWTSLDYCESNPQVWAAGWDNSAANAGSGAVSLDGGEIWMPFGAAARKTVVNSATAGTESWDLTPFIAQRKATGNNIITLAVVSSRIKSASSLTFSSRESSVTENRPKLLVSSSTTSTTLYAVADTYVDGATSFSDTNYGNSTTLLVRNNNNSTSYKRWIYLRFDLSSVGTVNSASLQLYRNAAMDTVSFDVGVFASTNTTWVEGDGGSDNSPANEVTWNNRPQLLASVDSMAYADPYSNPKYYDGSTSLKGGRVVVSSTNPNNFVWLPEGTSNFSRYSLDRGVTWTVSSGGPKSMMTTRFDPSVIMQQLAADRVNGNFYLARFNEGGGGKHYIYRSTDGGATFAQVGMATGGSSNVYRCQIAAAPPTPSHPSGGDLWLCDDGVSTYTAGGIWHSIDGGVTWNKLPGVKAVDVMGFGKGPGGSDYSVFIVGYYNNVLGVYRSDNQGSSWEKLDEFPSIATITHIAGDMQQHGKVYVGTSGRGIFQLP